MKKKLFIWKDKSIYPVYETKKAEIGHICLLLHLKFYSPTYQDKIPFTFFTNRKQ